MSGRRNYEGVAENSDILHRDMLQRMWLIRSFEERVIDLCHRKQLAGLVHVGIGQEGVAVGVATAMGDDDYLYGTHRSHGHFLARGADPNGLMAELAGKDTGCCRGRGGSMHIVEVGRRLMSATGIVGGTIPLALGTALVAREEGNVVAVYFGDGASNTGSFHECLNMASLWKLPVVLVCENNGYAEFTPMSAHTVVSHVSVHGQPYDMASQIVDGNDTLAVLEAARNAVVRARDGGGPTIVECLTYRLRGHYVGDPESYRKADEVDEWRGKDPIRRFTSVLRDRGAVTARDVRRMEESARARVEDAVRFMQESPWPSSASVADFVYA
ncbi:MAG: pyruvate dehydrogenase (acetyl-transferring) E1 component subunit alpha [Rhizobiales bacterium]|nr:pyruvate dehydrogenase (acetyl-transferring) E1 component subunit alpha [Hyphomicrobiales bacterium]